MRDKQDLDRLFTCPNCRNIFKEVNGLFVRCECGYIEDSTFSQITLWDIFSSQNLKKPLYSKSTKSKLKKTK